MTKEHAYAYEAGYRDGSIHYELEHCPACKNVADLQKALDKIDQLKKELEVVYALAEASGHYYKAAKAENVRIRVLVAKMARAMNVASEWCDCDCGAEFGCTDGRECPIEKEMHELGITNYGRDASND